MGKPSPLASSAPGHCMLNARYRRPGGWGGSRGRHSQALLNALNAGVRRRSLECCGVARLGEGVFVMILPLYLHITVVVRRRIQIVSRRRTQNACG